MKILVTGAAGFIGSHVAERLHADGYDVIAVDALTPYYNVAQKRKNLQDLLVSGIECRELDLREAKLSPILDGVEFCVHLAAQPGISATTPFDDYLGNNIIATRMLMDQLEAVPGFKGLVNIATSSIYGRRADRAEDAVPEPISVYGATKLAAEQLALARSRDGRLPACSLRLYSVYGPRERPDKLLPRAIRAALTGEQFPLYEGSLDHVRSFTYIRDIVDGIVRAVVLFKNCQNEIINLGTTRTYTTRDILGLVEKLTGNEIKISIQPPRPGDQQVTHAVIDKAVKMLEYNPLTPAADGIRAEIKWLDELMSPK